MLVVLFGFEAKIMRVLGDLLVKMHECCLIVLRGIYGSLRKSHSFVMVGLEDFIFPNILVLLRASR